MTFLGLPLWAWHRGPRFTNPAGRICKTSPAKLAYTREWNYAHRERINARRRARRAAGLMA